ncbi:MAG: PadR family transcriptional regulator [Candidatus Odinarchaeota archaeon]
MIGNITGHDLESLIESGSHRKFLENFESELLRGIGKLCILKVIKNHPEGIHGYQLLKDLKELTENMLIIKEGTLYPLLRNLEKWESKGSKLSLIRSEKNFDGDRPRKYYYLTEEGVKTLSHMEGFFLKLLEAISGIIDFQIILKEEKYTFCQNCKARFEDPNNTIQSCEICGFDLKNENQEG